MIGAVILKKGGGQKISGATSKTPFSCKVALLMRCEKVLISLKTRKLISHLVTSSDKLCLLLGGDAIMVFNYLNLDNSTAVYSTLVKITNRPYNPYQSLVL